MRGRKPAPAPALNVVEGGFGAAPQIAEPDWLMPYPEEGWGVRAAEISSGQWKVVTTHMRAAGTLGPENGAQVEIYCTSYARWKLCEAHVAEYGPIVPDADTGLPIDNPYLKPAKAAAEMVAKMGAALGLPPDMRGRVGKANGAKKASRAADTYLAGGRKT